MTNRHPRADEQASPGCDEQTTLGGAGQTIPGGTGQATLGGAGQTTLGGVGQTTPGSAGQATPGSAVHNRAGAIPQEATAGADPQEATATLEPVAKEVVATVERLQEVAAVVEPLAFTTFPSAAHAAAVEVGMAGSPTNMFRSVFNHLSMIKL
ncbi:UNVERIFIED_CONTAM: hypothetical protein FKN15_019062 [Acipenser sinensis]